jgi:chemotaxis protein CheX
MNVEFVNPFVASTLEVFETMLATVLSRGRIRLRAPGEVSGGITGIIGIAGRVNGMAAIGINDDVAIRMCERFLNAPVSAVNDDVVDCVGEVINMVAGGAKARLEQHALSISLPSVVRGPQHVIEFPKGATPVCIPFTADLGEIQLQIGFIAAEVAQSPVSCDNSRESQPWSYPSPTTG